MKWPDGTSDHAKPQRHTRVCQLYTGAHTAAGAIAAPDRQCTEWTNTFYFYSNHDFKQSDNVCFFHKQGGLIKPVSTDAYLYCWWSLVLRVFAMKRSASFSRFLEYSISISDFFLKKSWRSCSSWTLMSVCWSKHFCCSTSWARISGGTQVSKRIRMMPQPLGMSTHSHTTRTFFWSPPNMCDRKHV